MPIPTGFKCYVPLVAFPKYQIMNNRIFCIGFWKRFLNLLMIGFSISRKRLIVQKGINRTLYTKRYWSAGDNLTKRVLQIVSKAKGNSLDHRSPVVSVSLKLLSLRIPLVLQPCLVIEGDRNSNNSTKFAKFQLKLNPPSGVGASVTRYCGM